MGELAIVNFRLLIEKRMLASLAKDTRSG
jgi:hypothetical protein